MNSFHYSKGQETKASFRKAVEKIAGMLHQGRNSQSGFKEVFLGVERTLLRETDLGNVSLLSFNFENFISKLNSLLFFYPPVTFSPMKVPLLCR